MTNKIYLKLVFLLLLFIIIFKDADSLTQSERDDLKNKINELKDNKEYFENLLLFLENNFNLKDEPEITGMLKDNAEILGIDISKYPKTFGEIKKEEVKETQAESKNDNALKLILLLIILALIFYIMKKFIKNKNIKK